MNAERRREERTFRIIPIRYRKSGESTFNVGDVIDITGRGFCMIMPIDLDLDEQFEFEAFDGGTSIKGEARVVWIDRGHMKAGCRYTKQKETVDVVSSRP